MNQLNIMVLLHGEHLYRFITVTAGFSSVTCPLFNQILAGEMK